MTLEELESYMKSKAASVFAYYPDQFSSLNNATSLVESLIKFKAN
jgi:hypothetical protein